MIPEDEFYIGWEAKAPSQLAATIRRAVGLILIVCALLAVAFAVFQRTIAVSVFEWGQVKEFNGILRATPYPHFLVTRPGIASASQRFSSYYLVKPFKFGLDPKLVTRLDGQRVTLRGTLIYRDDQTMIEAIPDSIRADESSSNQVVGTPPVSNLMDLGTKTLEGEIVDSKCYFGVMNPGQFVPHRACAIRCISGGSPPVFVVPQPTGPPACFLLVSADGRPVNKQVLDRVAEPLRITGQVLRQDNLLILRSDPSTYKRLDNSLMKN